MVREDACGKYFRLIPLHWPLALVLRFVVVRHSRIEHYINLGKEGRKVRLKTKGKQMGDVQVNRSPGLKLLYRGPSFLPAVINLATAATQTLPFRSFTIGAGHL